MITTSDIADILYRDCNQFGIEAIYRKGNVPEVTGGKLSTERIVILPKPQQPGKQWLKDFVEVNLCVPDLDDILTGLNKSDLILLASRPGMGKTSFALNIAVNVAQKSDTSIAIFSLEMSKEQLVSRLLSSLASVNSKKLLTGRLTDDEWKRIAYAAGMLSNSGLLIDDNSMLTVSDINAECRRVQNLGLVIIDYLQLMSTASGSNAESRQQTVSEMSRMLKIMAKELNVPVICCCQLSRASAQRTEKRPILSDLRESGSLEQDADIVLGLYREDYFNREAESHNVAECIVMKNRHGNTGTVKLLWEPEFTRFQALDTTHEEESY